MKQFIYTLLFIVIASFTLSSCNEKLVYDQYLHTPIAGWEKNDVLSYDISGIDESGYYQQDLGLRITSAYPFMNLTLIISSQRYANNKDCQVNNDTLVCKLINKNGNTYGQGISYYQYDFPVSKRYLAKGDSLHIEIRHDMKREIMPGISDVGIKLSKSSSY